MTQQEYDVIVVGSGAAGMVAALTAAHQGLSTLVVEKAPHYGGSTARSGGGVWIPNNEILERDGVQDTAEALTLGAATTHAAIADGRTPDLPGQVLARIAAGIAYRAVRNRGTIGGSLCHADPAADWLTTLMALGAVVLTTRRAMAVQAFVTGPYRTALQPGEIVRAVQVQRPAPGFGWGYQKLCRKPGEFAHAMAAALVTPSGRRLAIGAVGGPPVLLLDEHATKAGAQAALGFLEAVERRMQLEAVARALQEAGA